MQGNSSIQAIFSNYNLFFKKIEKVSRLRNLPLLRSEASCAKPTSKPMLTQAQTRRSLSMKSSKAFLKNSQ